MNGWEVATVIFGLLLIVGPILCFGWYLKEARSIIKEHQGKC